MISRAPHPLPTGSYHRQQLADLGVPDRQRLPQPSVGTAKLLNQLHTRRPGHKQRSSLSTPGNQAPTPARHPTTARPTGHTPPVNGLVHRPSVTGVPSRATTPIGAASGKRSPD